MKYNELIYSIRERIKQNSDDSNISNREILFYINQQRSLFYRNQYNQRNRIIDNDVKQNLYVDVSLHSKDLCGNTETCTIVRSDKPLPNAIELHHKNAILNVTSVNIGVPDFSFVNWQQFKIAGVGRYTRNQIYASVHTDGYLYLKSSNPLVKQLNKVIVTAILENPLDVKGFQNCDSKEEDCFDLSTFEYPLKGYALAYIQNQIVNIFLNKIQMPEDEENNSDDINYAQGNTKR